MASNTTRMVGVYFPLSNRVHTDALKFRVDKYVSVWYIDNRQAAVGRDHWKESMNNA